MRYSMVFVWLLISSFAFGDQRADKIAALVKAQGLLESWQYQIDVSRKQEREYGKDMMDKFLQKMNPNAEYTKRFQKAYEKFLLNSEYPGDAQAMVEVWAKLFGPRFTDDELDELIRFYTSELGKKEVAAVKETLVEFDEQLIGESKARIDKAIKEYIEELQVVATECRCEKKPSSEGLQ
jgi:uncharacterized protein DUF2059